MALVAADFDELSRIELRRQPEKFQASVCGTAAAYLTLWADEIVARNTAR